MIENSVTLSEYNGPLSEATDEQLIIKAKSIFQKLYESNSFIRTCMKEADRFYQLRHWEGVPKKNEKEPRPTNPVLFSTIDSIHADIVDASPTTSIIGESSEQSEIAEMLDDVLKYIRKRRKFAKTYSKWSLNLIIYGMACSKTWWDASLPHGGDVSFSKVDPRSLLYDPNVENINDSHAVIEYWFMDKDMAKKTYPKFKGDNGTSDAAKWSDSFERLSEKSEKHNEENEILCFDLWWREPIVSEEADQSVKWNVYTCRVVGGKITSRNTNKSVYEHGEYPYDVTPLYSVPGRLWGMGIVDIFKDMQLHIDSTDQLLVRILKLAAKIRMLARRGADIDKQALMDYDEELIEGESIGDQDVRFLQAPPIPSWAIPYITHKIGLLKEESGQNQFNRGEGGKSITAASAIMALQEAGNKRSRKIISDSVYPWMEDITRKAVSIVAQYYKKDRTIMITGKDGHMKQAIISAEKIKKNKEIINCLIQVNPERNVPYKDAYHNETIGTLMQYGLPAEMAVYMLEYDRKDDVIKQYEESRDNTIKKQQQFIEQLQAEIQQKDGQLRQMENNIPRKQVGLGGTASHNAGFSNI